MKKWLWKIYYWVMCFFAVCSPLLIFSDGKQHIIAYTTDTFFFIGYAVAMYSYLYRKFPKYLSYWKTFFWMNIAYLICSTAYQFFPTSAIGKMLAIFSETGSPTSMTDMVISFLITLPILYSIYQLSNGKGNIFKYKRKKRKSIFKKFTLPNLTASPHWSTVQTAVWGYSTIMLCNIFIASLLPSKGNGSGSPDIILDTLTFFPLALYWAMVLTEYKKYQWSWGKKTLMLNSALYIILIFNSIFSSAMHPSVHVKTESAGFNYIGLSEVMMGIISLIIFGREMLNNSSETQKFV